MFIIMRRSKLLFIIETLPFFFFFYSVFFDLAKNKIEHRRSGKAFQNRNFSVKEEVISILASSIKDK